MSVELPYRPDSDHLDFNDDWPKTETVKKWKLLFESTDPEAAKEKNALIIRHMAYARADLEELFCGSRLSLIELVELRRITEESLLQTIAYQELSDEEKFDAGIMPLNEIPERFLNECMDISFDVVHQFYRLHKEEEIHNYLFRKHEEMHTL